MGKFLVTGGCGFIGSHLTEALLARGHDVRVLDDLSTGRLENLPAGADLVRGDVADRALVARALEGLDGCYHLAAIASVERANRDWIGTHRTNLTGTVTVLDAARTARRGRPVPVVYASSAAVYGDNGRTPLDEDATTRPLSAYGADKLGCELHARVAGSVHGVPTAGLRFFNVYGPRQDPTSPYSGVISIFCDRIRRGAGVTVYGDGGQTRDFVYVGDVVSALVAAMGRLETVPGIEVVNVCTGRATTVNGLAATVAALCGSELRIERAPARAGEIRVSLGHPGRLAARLGVTAGTGLREGLAWTLAATGEPGLRRAAGA